MEEEPAPELESEEMKQLRDMIQVAMGAELKQVCNQSLLFLPLSQCLNENLTNCDPQKQFYR